MWVINIHEWEDNEKQTSGGRTPERQTVDHRHYWFWRKWIPDELPGGRFSRNISLTKISCYCKGRNFRWRKISYFPVQTFRMELNFVLSNWPKTGKTRKDDQKAYKPCGKFLAWKLISYIFELYESYEIKFPTKISSFTEFSTVRIGYRVTGYNDLPGITIGLTKIKIKTTKRHTKYQYYHYIQCIIGCSDISVITMGIEKSNHQILYKKYQL